MSEREPISETIPHKQEVFKAKGNLMEFYRWDVLSYRSHVICMFRKRWIQSFENEDIKLFLNEHQVLDEFYEPVNIIISKTKCNISKKYKELRIPIKNVVLLLFYMAYFLVYLFSKVPHLGWLFTFSCFPLKFKLQRFFDFECEESDSKFACVCSLRRSWRVASFFKFMSEYGQPKALVCIKMSTVVSLWR